jgi:glycine/D-amino acid oxidase-like deaminating enzyme
VVMDDSPAQLTLTRYSQTLWDVFVQDALARHEYTRCGTIWVAADDGEMQAAHRKHSGYREHGIASDLLDEHALYALEPNLRPGLLGGLLVPGDSVVYPPGSAALFLERAAQCGARLLYGRAGCLVPNGMQLSSGAVVKGGAIVIATGARAVELVPEVPIRARKGHLAITDRYPGFVRHQLVELGYSKSAHAASGDSVAFNVQPRCTGQVLIGSSRQFDVRTAEVDLHILARMLGRALGYLPGLAGISCIRTWTGFRAATPDGLPLIGPHPGRPDIWLATGHEGLGITTAPGTAKLLAAQMLKRAPEIPAEPYLPSRILCGAAHV